MSTHPHSTDPGVLRMAAPLVISFVLRGAFTFVDTIYAAMIGDAAVAAIGLTVPFEFLMIALWVGLSTGLTSNLSRTIGSGESEKTQQYLRAMRWLVSGVAPLFFLAGIGIWFWAPRMGLEQEVSRAFQIYGSVLVGGSAWTAFWSVLPDSIVKAHQDTRSTMWAGILSSLLNVALNTLFLFVFHWGVFGIALSTVIGRLGGLLYAMGRARAHEARRLAASDGDVSGLDAQPFRSLLALAVPASVTFGLMAAETGLVNFLLAGTPTQTESIAAYSIYYRVNLFLLNPVIATAVAMLPFVARRVGRSDYAGIRIGLRRAGLASVLYSLFFVAPLMLMIAGPLARALAESTVTAEITSQALRYVPINCLVIIPFLLCRPVFEGMGRGRPGLIMATLRYVVLAFPGAWLGLYWAERVGVSGVTGIVLGLVGVSLVSSLLFLVWLRRDLSRR